MYKVDTTEEVMGQIEELVRDMTCTIEVMHCHHIDARHEYDRLGVEDEFFNDGEHLSQEIDEGIEMMTEYADNFHMELTRFDQQLASLIQLRGKLAEETGIPLMSHLGTKGFGRASAEFVM
jgi:hypothetical protein